MLWCYFMIRKAWLACFLIGIFLEILAFFIHRQIVLSSISVAFFYAVYRSCYRSTGTALLTLMIWTYSTLFTLFTLVCLLLFAGGHLGNAPIVFRQPTVMLAEVCSSGYLLLYFYLTIQLRRLNCAKSIL